MAKKKPADEAPRHELVNVTGAPVRVWGPFGERVIKPGQRVESPTPFAGFRLEPVKA